MSAKLQRIEVEPGVQLAVSDSGGDQPVLLTSNSLAADMSMWDELAARLGDQFRLVRYDTRGHGGSDIGSSAVTIDRLGRDVIAIMDALGIQQAIFCGLSLGGLTGMWLGIHHGDRFSRLVFANTAANFPPATMWQERAAQVRANGMQPLVQPTLERWFTAPFRQSHAERVAAVGTSIAATPADGYAACCEVLAATNLLPQLGRIARPVLVISGTHDASTPPARGDEIASAIRDAKTVTLNAAHVSAIEAADAFTEQIRTFAPR